MKKYRYYMSIPFTGIIHEILESDTPLDECTPDSLYDELEDITLKYGKMKIENAEVAEWSVHAEICRGNTFYGILNEIEIDETEELHSNEDCDDEDGDQ